MHAKSQIYGKDEFSLHTTKFIRCCNVWPFIWLYYLFMYLYRTYPSACLVVVQVHQATRLCRGRRFDAVSPPLIRLLLVVQIKHF